MDFAYSCNVTSAFLFSQSLEIIVFFLSFVQIEMFVFLFFEMFLLKNGIKFA